MNKLIVFAAVVCTAIATRALAAEVSYRNDIRALIKVQCLECHGEESPTLAEFLQNQAKFKKEKMGPRLGSYAELIQVIGWPQTGALMRRLDDGSNSPNKKPGSMYKQLGETDALRAANLNLIKAWVGEAAWNLNAWEKTDDVPAISKEQLDKLKLSY
jgi:mono/diheme cytochrome c family protein